MKKSDLNSANSTKQLIDTLLPSLKKIALEAGEKVMHIYTSDEIEYSTKEDQSPVSVADLEAHKHIALKLSILSEYPVVSEEDSNSLENRNSTGWFWLIDPLDGTKEFIGRNGEFTINIALIGEGISHFGLVYAPAINLMYWGGKEFDAYRLDKDGTQKINVSKTTSPQHRVVASKNHLNDETKSFIEKLESVNLIQSGSSLKFCRIAEGSADIYPRLTPTCEWDTAAAQAILEGAGGAVVDVNKKPLRYGKMNVINPSFIATREVSLIP